MSQRIVHHSIELFFDEALEAAVVANMQRLADAKLPAPLLEWGMRPHITLGLFEQPGDGLRAAVEELGASTPAWPARLDAVGTFAGDEGVVFFFPAVTQTLLEVHARFHATCGPHFAGSRSHYAPGGWMPHCTQSIRLTPEQLAQTVRVCRDAPLPLDGRFERLGYHVTEIDPSVPTVETRYPWSVSLSG
ncbi:MAG: 2'-5' RNA ligase family protein [Planctomycetota bacterium]|jgi:hypothetical protein